MIIKKDREENALYICSLTIIAEVGGGQQNKKATRIQRNCEGLNRKYTVG